MKLQLRQDIALKLFRLIFQQLVHYMGSILLLMHSEQKDGGKIKGVIYKEAKNVVIGIN